MVTVSKHNPLRLWAQICALLIIGDIVNMIWLDYKILSAFRIPCFLVFLYLYCRDSKYAWHTITLIFATSFPIYWLLRAFEYYPPPKYILNDWLQLAVWLVLIILMAKLRKPYLNYLSSQDRNIISFGFRRNSREPNRALAVNKLKRAGESFAFVLFLVVLLIALIFVAKQTNQTLRSILKVIGGIIILLGFVAIVQALYSIILAWLAYLGIFKNASAEQEYSQMNDDNSKE